MLTTDHPLSSLIRGRVSRAGDDDWDSARQAFNLLVDQRPELVAFPVDERDVIATVRHARHNGFQIAAQATGHNAGPLGSLEGTILLNTSRLVSASIDAAARRVRVGAGTKWQDVIAPLSDLGLAALHGSSPDVGIVGYSLGGGMGWLGRRHGLQCNSVTAIELVTADGHLIRTDHEHEPELFWALRGGGGNFGVVTAIEFEVYPLRELYAGAMFFPFERATEVLQTWNAVSPSFPEELTSWASVLHVPDLPFVPEPVRGGSFAVILGAFLGDEQQGREILAPIRALGPIMDTFAIVPPAGLAELAMDPPDPLPSVTAHHNIGPIDDRTLDRLVGALGRDSGIVALQLRALGGAFSRPPRGAGVRSTLDGTMAMFAAAIAPTAPAAALAEQSLARVKAVLEPARVGEYANFVEVPVDASAFYDAESWSRLRAIKSLYDPCDLFRGNHRVPPAA